MELLSLLTEPATWAALLTLVLLEIVLGIDNLVFIAILSNKLPAEQQARARRIGLSLALLMRIGLLMFIGWLVTLRTPLQHVVTDRFGDLLVRPRSGVADELDNFLG